MVDPATLTADALLRIPADEPERLFSADPVRLQAEYRRLAALWHPDRRSDACAAGVFQRITELYRLALHRLRTDDWRTPGILTLHARDGARRAFPYRRRHRFELGQHYVGTDAIAFVLASEHTDLLDNALRRIAGLRFAGADMREEMLRCLPMPEGRYTTPDGPCVVLRKAPGLVLLRDLVERLGGRLPPRHTAWVLSSLYNLACYLDFASIAHNAIGLDSYFVDPAAHGGALLGGWWYAERAGGSLHALPLRTADLLTPQALATRRADPRTDLALIRATGRELLGDPAGTRLARDPAVPAPLADWLRGAAADSAIEEYEQWQQVLKASFGARRFVELGLTASDIDG